MNTLEKLYSWLWFHTEFWITSKFHRRPFTFIMRDWMWDYPKVAIILVLSWYAGMLALLKWHPFIAGCFLIGSSLILAHLIWGSKYIEGEQEVPPYLGDDDD